MRYFVDVVNGFLWESGETKFGEKRPLTVVGSSYANYSSENCSPGIFYPLPKEAKPGSWLYDLRTDWIFRWDGGLALDRHGDCCLTGDHGGTMEEPAEPEDQKPVGCMEVDVSDQLELAGHSMVKTYLALLSKTDYTNLLYDTPSDTLLLLQNIPTEWGTRQTLIYEKGQWQDVQKSPTFTNDEHRGDAEHQTPYHYDLPIQPEEYITQNGLDWDSGNVVKYITRHRDKNGQDDLEKAMVYIRKLISKYDKLNGGV